LRLLRGVRLAVELDCEIEAATFSAMRQHAPLLERAAFERQRDELMRMFSTPRGAVAVRLMDALGLLDIVLPELTPARHTDQPTSHHFWDVFNHSVETLAALPPSRVVLLDVTPRQLLRIAGDGLSRFYRWRLARYRYGPGVFKMDWALNAPVPWRAPECHRAGTLHLGGSVAEIAASERASWDGRDFERPYVLVTQPGLFDPTRAPPGTHTLWAYCHVPHGSAVDMRERIERQIERYAPGFRDCIEEARVMSPADLERSNANLVGGDIAGGAADLAQLYTRPIASVNPYRTSIGNVFLCSSSTPPGVGVHGMSGYHAARAAMKRLRSPLSP